MVITLKILLFLLVVACIMTIAFIRREFVRVLGSQEFDESSIFERFVIYLMAFGSGIFLVAVAVFSVVILFSEVTVEFSW